METDIPIETPAAEEASNEASLEQLSSANPAQNGSNLAATPPPVDIQNLRRQRIGDLVAAGLNRDDPDAALQTYMKAGLYDFEADLADTLKESRSETGQFDPRLTNTRLRVVRLVAQITRFEQNSVAAKQRAETLVLQLKQLAERDPLLAGKPGNLPPSPFPCRFDLSANSDGPGPAPMPGEPMVESESEKNEN